MKSFRILSALAIVAATAGATGSAFADTGKDSGEIAMAASARVSTAQAIAAAEQRTGGHAVRVDIEKDNGAYHYEVKTLSNGKLTEVIVDPASGQVTNTDGEGFFGRLFEDDDQEDFKAVAASPITLAAAVSNAERHTGGKVIEARFDSDHGKNRFKVEVAKGNAVRKVIVDADGGSVVKVMNDDSDEQDD